MARKISLKLLIILSGILILINFISVTAYSAVPKKINYQGYLTDVNGYPVDETISMTFSIYDMQTEGTALWSETQDVDVINGVYSVVLGSVTAINLPFDDQYYLGIEVEADEEMTPRQPLASAGYAIRSGIADAVNAGSITEDKIADGAISPAKLADTCVDGDFLIKTPAGWGCFSTACIPQTEVCDRLDNDCDGSVDEDHPDLGNSCTTGTGICAAQGIYICTGDGSGTECSASAGAPQTEVCDSLDNDCDGSVDEDHPDLGNSCTTGTGICAAQGIYICTGDGSGTECSASAGAPQTEVCDNLDNDCDGSVDENWLNGGKYDQDTACGNCVTDCTAIFNKPNAYGTCDSTGTPVCTMTCNAGYFNVNIIPGDGCEFYLDPNVIYVSVNDPAATDNATCGLGPAGTGDGNYPCLSITQGLVRAQSLGRTEVHVANGLYNETITIIDGISLIGGYRADNWERHLNASLSIIKGSSAAGHKKTIIAQNITSLTTIEGFVIIGQNNSDPGGNSYGIWIKDSNDQLEVRNNSFQAGSAGNGLNSPDGNNGLSGRNGLPGIDAYDTSFNCYEECVVSAESPGGAGGNLSCSGANVSGGNGARALCPDWNEDIDMCIECAGQEKQSSTSNGQNGSNGGGAGGSGGFDGNMDEFCSGTCNKYVPTAGMTADNGANGSQGVNGTGGLGCSNADGTVVSGEWAGSNGESGSGGAHGGGGGGGGAGGGVETYDSLNCPYDGGSDIGGSGGGGGSGGCGGNGGAGGGAGGGSFAIFTVFTSPPGTNFPSIVNNEIHLGDGGEGGNGGFGGVGGIGGNGAAGGAGGAAGSNYSGAEAGGAGGIGGDGGHGGGGSGGCGGVSYGIYAFGQGSSDLSSWSLNNIFFADGTSGAGGTGGASYVNPGENGIAGASGNTNF